MGVPSIDDKKSEAYCLSPKIYQPVSDMDTMEFPRKKKMFSSSSFYEEPNAIYPTVEEQVELCRKIADSLSDECNLKSKGANMFFKRVKRAEKWIVAESNAQKENQLIDSTDAITDPAKLPYVRPSSKGLPKLKLILDPRHLVDMKRLLKEGVDIVEHNAVSPEICHDIVKDLNSPTGKGAQLFAKRKKKSAEWVVDEEKVKALLQNRQGGYHTSEPLMEPLMHPRVKSLSSPWSNINVNSQDVADTVIKAAEAKVMTYSVVPQVPVIEPLLRTEKSSHTTKKVSFATAMTPNLKPSQFSDAYKYRAPRGWTSSVTTDSFVTVDDSCALRECYSPVRSSVVSPLSRSLSGSDLPRTFSFANFNSTPKAWNSGITNQFLQSSHVKSVKPPSVLVQ